MGRDVEETDRWRRKSWRRRKTMVMRTCWLSMIPSQVDNPGSNFVLKLNLRCSPTVLLVVISLSVRWRNNGEPNLLTIELFILLFLILLLTLYEEAFFWMRNLTFRFAVKFYWNVVIDTMYLSGWLTGTETGSFNAAKTKFRYFPIFLITSQSMNLFL